MQRRGLKVTQSLDNEDWKREADLFCESLRGTKVPADILDLALAERTNYRQRLTAPGRIAENNH